MKLAEAITEEIVGLESRDEIQRVIQTNLTVLKHVFTEHIAMVRAIEVGKISAKFVGDIGFVGLADQIDAKMYDRLDSPFRKG